MLLVFVWPGDLRQRSLRPLAIRLVKRILEISPGLVEALPDMNLSDGLSSLVRKDQGLVIEPVF
jgi:hypothetical protein